MLEKDTGGAGYRTGYLTTAHQAQALALRTLDLLYGTPVNPASCDSSGVMCTCDAAAWYVMATPHNEATPHSLIIAPLSFYLTGGGAAIYLIPADAVAPATRTLLP